MEVIFGEGEEEGSRDIVLCVPFSPSPFSEPEHVIQSGKHQAFGSSLKPGWDFPLLPGEFEELLSLLCDLLMLPLCKKLDFSQRPQ